jgi:hypothetical protein
MSELNPLDEERPTRLDRARARVEFRLGPKIQAATEELESINAELAKLNVDSLPKILQIKVGKREYTSIRRVESVGIRRKEVPSESPAFHIIDYSIRADLIDEGQVGAILIPSTHAVAKDKDLIEFLESQESDIERETGWGTTLPVALEKGVPFKFNEWAYGGMPLFTTIKRVKGELFFIQTPYRYGQNIFTEEKGRRIAIARRVKPDQEGEVTLFRNDGWWTIAEIEVQRELDQKFVAFYVMVEGKSEQERQEEPGGLKRLGPRLSEVTG